MKTKFKISVIPALLLVSFFMFNDNKKDDTTVNIDQTPAWVAPAEENNNVNPLEIDEYTLEDGKDVYTANCLACHGEAGDANTPAAAAFNPKPKNFRSANFLSQSDGAIFWKLSTGRGMMQSYKEILSEEERWSVIVYVKDLAKK